jgi:hypothetical protein
MASGTGLLAVWMQIPPDLEADLNDWYTKEHLPERIAIPGFHSALRYLSLMGEPKYMALYDLETPGVLYSDAYVAMRKNATDWTRRIGRALEKNLRHEYELLESLGDEPADPAPYVALIRLGGEQEEATDAFVKKVLEAFSSVPGVVRARSFKAVVGSPKYLAYMELRGEDIYGSEAWRRVENDLLETKSETNVWSINYGKFIESAEFEGPRK